MLKLTSIYAGNIKKSEVKGKHYLYVVNEKCLTKYATFIFTNREKILSKLAYPKNVCYTSLYKK